MQYSEHGSMAVTSRRFTDGSFSASASAALFALALSCCPLSASAGPPASGGNQSIYHLEGPSDCGDWLAARGAGHSVSVSLEHFVIGLLNGMSIATIRVLGR
jgi:hypothetical protein